jgi:hypothetical protein
MMFQLSRPPIFASRDVILRDVSILVTASDRDLTPARPRAAIAAFTTSFAKCSQLFQLARPQAAIAPPKSAATLAY